jgi:biopolymer transport protein ExbB/TolQ
MGLLTRAVVLLLVVMLFYLALIALNRFYSFFSARRHSRLFVHHVAAPMDKGDLNHAVAIATQHARGHVAKVVGLGLSAFIEAGPQITDVEAVGTAERALQRAQRSTVADLKRGAGTLTSIAICAPFVGLLGTILGISNAFYCSGFGCLTITLAEALATTALGLGVAIPSVWCRNYILTQVETFESEMSNARLETITYLAGHSQLRCISRNPLTGALRHVSALEDVSGKHRWEVPYDRPRALLLPVLLGTLFFVLLFILGVLASLG